MAVVARATANQAMVVFTSLIVCASFVNADKCDSSMMQMVVKDTTDVEFPEVPMAKMAVSSMPAMRFGDKATQAKPKKNKKKAEDKAKAKNASSYKDAGHAGADSGAPQRGTCRGLRAASSYRDAGFADEFRGWYDVQGCGECLDYCRWVGDSGSGGDPALQTQQGNKYWSCNLAGSGDPYTPDGHFGATFLHKKCVGVPSTSGAGAARMLR